MRIGGAQGAPPLKVYDSKTGWPRNENNWNQVCNGGLLSGALAIAESEPHLAARIVFEAAQRVPRAMQDNAGRRKLAIHLKNVQDTRIQALMAP
jgi:hypothetical protein